MFKRFLKKLIPRKLLQLYHYCLAVLASYYYGRPSEKMIIIGVTGTAGKTTVGYLIAQLLELAGEPVGLSSTAIFKVADQEWLNDKKMTMLGRFQTHRLLRQMVNAGCHYAVVETSSEGILQFRHIGIHYDVGVFTNLTPEHLEAHGGFANYKAYKLKLFKTLEKLPHKKLNGKIIPKSLIVNLDDSHAADFLNFRVDQKITYSTSEKLLRGVSPQPLVAVNIKADSNGLNFTIGKNNFHSPLIGRFNVYNNLAVIGVMKALGFSLDQLVGLLPQTKPCPGRLEFIDAGQDFKVIVDYAFVPKALQGLYQAVESFKKPGSRVIQVLGSTGGGRDKTIRPQKGELAAEHADFVIVANEDPYDEDPLEIINQVASGAKQKGKVEGRNLFKFLDRREGIATALSLAQKNDIVLITGKGSEQAMVVKNNKLIPWDDRKVVREELKKLVITILCPSKPSSKY